jgi:hypothetical protein
MSVDTILQDHFLLVAGTLIAASPSPPHPGSIGSAVETMAELFRALQAPPRESVQGLWAEVLLIAESPRSADLVTAWHVATDDRFDFSSRMARVEVKSASGGERVHHFSLDQLRPPAGVRALIASVLVERAGGGTSVEDLLAELRATLAPSPELMLKAESIVTATLGSTFRAAIGERFDREAARGSLAYFRAEDVPSLQEAPPFGVTDVRFRSDLGASRPVRPRDLIRGSEDQLLASLPPTHERPHR